jgi:hypothetical protein
MAVIEERILRHEFEVHVDGKSLLALGYGEESQQHARLAEVWDSELEIAYQGR